MDVTITCPSCRTTMNILDGYIERCKREGVPVRCPNFYCQHILDGYIERCKREGVPVRYPNFYCQHILIKNEKEVGNDNTTGD